MLMPIDQIWGQIDTQQRLLLILNQIDDCIAFITTAGGSNWQSDGDTMLAAFILDVVLVDPRKWEEMACDALTRNVKMCHIKSLKEGLVALSHGGNIFHDVPPLYDQPLSDAQKEGLRVCAAHAGPVLPTLRQVEPSLTPSPPRC